MGRWMSPDWSAKAEPVPYSKLDNPQTLNLYSYVQNNPLSNLDDDGHVTIELRYTPVAVGNHTYVVVTDTNGHQTYYRAGPTNGASSGWITPASSGSSTQGAGSNSSNSSNSTTPGAGPGDAGADTGPFGALGSAWRLCAWNCRLRNEPGSHSDPTIQRSTCSFVHRSGQPIRKHHQWSEHPLQSAQYEQQRIRSRCCPVRGLTPPATPPVLAPGHDTPLPVPPPASPAPPPPPSCSVAGACH